MNMKGGQYPLPTLTPSNIGRGEPHGGDLVLVTINMYERRVHAYTAEPDADESRHYLHADMARLAAQVDGHALTMR